MCVSLAVCICFYCTVSQYHSNTVLLLLKFCVFPPSLSTLFPLPLLLLLLLLLILLYYWCCCCCFVVAAATVAGTDTGTGSGDAGVAV